MKNSGTLNPMTATKSPLGPTGKTVAANIERLREHQNLTYAELSRQLDELDARIPELGLRNIEKGKRRVDVDELVALAVILKTTPNALLTPRAAAAGELVEVTGLGEIAAAHFEGWLKDGIDRRSKVELLDAADRLTRSLPEYRRHTDEHGGARRDRLDAIEESVELLRAELDRLRNG